MYLNVKKIRVRCYGTCFHKVKKMVLLQWIIPVIKQWKLVSLQLKDGEKGEESKLNKICCTNTCSKIFLRCKYASSGVSLRSTIKRSILLMTSTGRIFSSHACRRTAWVYQKGHSLYFFLKNHRKLGITNKTEC